MIAITIFPIFAIFYWIWYASVFDSCWGRSNTSGISEETRQALKSYGVQRRAIDSLKRQMFD